MVYDRPVAYLGYIEVLDRGSLRQVSARKPDRSLLIPFSITRMSRRLAGPDLCVPIHEKKLVLGTWQQLVFN